jgi:hypothetical protein
MSAIDSSLIPHVAILLCAYKGDQFIFEQLDSIFSQTHKNLSLWVSLDTENQSTHQDEFYCKLAEYRDIKNNNPSNCIKMTVLIGPGKGCNDNFLSLVCNEDIQADYFAYSDQDDIWNADKIDRALYVLQGFPSDKPNLYCSRTRLIDEIGRDIGFSPLFSRKPSFLNALVQNIGGGNTMLFNRTSRDILKDIGNIEVVCHDWWTYMVVAGAGGNIVYDPLPFIGYRQHENNFIGANVGWKARFIRAKLLLKGKLEEWNGINERALKKASRYITFDNQNLMNNYFEVRKKKWIFLRIWGIYKAQVYRQTFIGNVGLWVAALLKKI